MPFKSEKQRRYLWANEPEIARDWTDTYGSRIHKKNGGILGSNAGSMLVTPTRDGTRPGYYGPDEGWSDSDWGTSSSSNTNQGNNDQGAQGSDAGWENVQSSESFNPPGWDQPGTTNQQIIQGGETWQAKTDKEVKQDIKDRKDQEIIDAGGDKNNDGKISWVEKHNYNYRNKRTAHYQKRALNNIRNKLKLAGVDITDFNSIQDIQNWLQGDFTGEEFATTFKDLNYRNPESFDKYNHEMWNKLTGETGYIPTSPSWKHPLLDAAGLYKKGLSLDEIQRDIDRANFIGTPEDLEMNWLDRMKLHSPQQYASYMGGMNYNPRTGEFTERGGGGGDSSNFPVRTLPYIPGDDDPSDGDPDDGGGGGTGSGVVYPYAGYGTPGYQTSDTFMNLAYPGGRNFLLAKGGRVPAAFGGIMDTATGRRGYFLGSIGDAIGDAIGGVAKAAGKVLKSPIGKAAVLGLGAYYMPGFGIKATGGFGNMFNPSGFFGKALLKKGAQDWAWKNLSAGKIIGGLSALPFLGIGTKAKQDTLGVADRGGHLIDPITKKEALPAEMRASLNDALSAAWNEDKQAYESEAMAAIKQAYPFLGQYPIYKVKDGGRIGAQEGGLMNLGGMEKDYRNNGGFVAIGGEERADDVPARLSRNEFVFTADAVRGAGGGDIDKGAEIMENVMKNLEQGGKISEESQGNTGAQEMFSVSQRIGEVL